LRLLSTELYLIGQPSREVSELSVVTQQIVNKIRSIGFEHNTVAIARTIRVCLIIIKSTKSSRSWKPARNAIDKIDNPNRKYRILTHILIVNMQNSKNT
jgi:hypothetical protein